MTVPPVWSWLQQIGNPFAQVRVDSPWQSVAADVAAINNGAFQSCIRTIEDVARTGGGHGVLLAGAPGTGKTHVLSRLRRWMHEQQAGTFVYVLPVTTPDRFNRHVLRALVEDLLRPEDADGAGAGGTSQLEAAVARLCSGTIRRAADLRQWWVDERHRLAPADLVAALQDQLAPAVDARQLDPTVVRVVLNHLAGRHRTDARAWLLGQPVTEEQANRLEVSLLLDDDETAREALVTLARLTGEQATIVFAFDQIEGLRVSRDDTLPFVKWAHGVADLLARLRNVAVITCLQVHFLEELRAAIGPAFFDGRVAERQASLAMLEPREAKALVASRLMASTDLQMARLFLRARADAPAAIPDPSDETWPITADVVERLALAGVTARALLLRCRQIYDERSQPEERQSPEAPAPIQSDARSYISRKHERAEGGNSLERAFEEAYEEERARGADEIDDGILSDGLLRTFGILRPAGSAERSAERDVTVRLTDGGSRVAIGVCNARHMTSVAAKLRRLGALVPVAGERLVLLRDARLSISPTAVATRRYLADLEARGTALVRSSPEAYAALAAIRRLLAEAAAGDLVIDGVSVAPETVQAWLSTSMPAAVRELVEQLFEESPASDDDWLDRLRGALDDAWVMSVEDASAKSALSAEAIWALATRHGNVIGTLAGPPAVVFLLPDAVGVR
jgi:hypothetical protein